MGAMKDLATTRGIDYTLVDHWRTIMDDRAWVTTLQDGPDIDADAADCIVQVACFGKVVYG